MFTEKCTAATQRAFKKEKKISVRNSSSTKAIIRAVAVFQQTSNVNDKPRSGRGHSARIEYHIKEFGHQSRKIVAWASSNYLIDLSEEY